MTSGPVALHRAEVACCKETALEQNREAACPPNVAPFMAIRDCQNLPMAPLETLQRRVAASDAPGIGCVAQGEAARWLGHKNLVKSFRTVFPKRCTVSGILSPEKIFAGFYCFSTRLRLRSQDFPSFVERTHQAGHFGCSPSFRAS